MNNDRIRRAIRNMWNRQEENQWLFGTAGRRNSDESYTFDVPGRKNFIYVTIRQANGAQTSVPARNDAGVPHQPRLGVKIKLEYGVYVVHGRTGRGDIANAPAVPSHGIAPHSSSHKHGGTDEVGTATPGANALVKADADGKIGSGWFDMADFPSDVGAAIHAASAKTTPVDADTMALVDSADSNLLKKVTWANIKATLKTYFDTLYNLYVHPNHTGDVTSSADGATTIANDAVTNAKLANMVQATIKGRASGVGTGDPTDLTATQVRTILNVADGANAYTHPNHTGDVTSTGDGATVIADEAVTLAKLLHVATDTVLGRSTSGTGDVELITLTAFARTLIDDVDAATARTTLGLVAGGAGDIWVEKAGDTMTGGLEIGLPGAGALLSFTDGFSITEGANTFITGFYRSATAGSSIVMTIIRAAANEALMGAGVNGDAFRRYLLLASGESQWGSGAATRDTNLYRNQANELKTDDSLVVAIDLMVIPGTSSNDAKVGGVLYVTTTQAGNVGTGEDDLAIYSIPANTLAVNGQSIWFEAWGTYANTVNTKTVRVRFGTSGTNLVINNTLPVSDDGTWSVRGRIVRTGASAQKGWGILTTEDAGTRTQSNTGLNQTLSGAITLKVQGEATTTNDIVLESLIVGWDNNNS